MIVHILLVAHIVVLGYWLGSEFVINSTFRYVSHAGAMPFAERDRLMDHVMDVDQHVRYALVLQAGLGTALAALFGYFPGGAALAWAAAAGAIAWLALVEATHRWRATARGQRLASIDRGLRYAAIAVLVGAGLLSPTGLVGLPGWLAWKLVAFAGVIGCGLGIRYAMMDFYGVWSVIEREGSSDAQEREIHGIYVRATGVLGLLWVFIAAVVTLSVIKP